MAPHPEIILFELTQLLSHVCEHDQTGLSPDMALDEIPGMDSLRLLQTIAHLEEHFLVEIDVDRLDDLRRVQDIVNAIADARPIAAIGSRDPAGGASE